MMTPVYIPMCSESMANVRALAHSASQMGWDVAGKAKSHGAPVTGVGEKSCAGRHLERPDAAGAPVFLEVW